MRTVSLTVNGAPVTAAVEPRLSLADFLREHRLLTGTHIGCEHGVCGACTILIGGEPARACITLAAACEGADVRTIEGLDDDPMAERLRAAFTAEHGLQCGYCTPGMLMTARDIVLRLPDADADRIRLELSGNLCRCTGYAGIVRAIERVLKERPAGVALPLRAPIAERAAPATSPIAAPVAMPVRTATASPGASLTQSVSLRLPGAKVWAAIRDPLLVATCVPGVTLGPDSNAERLQGEMAVALGPLRARFSGTAAVAYDDAARSGTIRGEGRDSISGTRLRAEANFLLVDESARASRIELAATYALQGPLAQFSRGGIVEALAEEIIRRVAANLEARVGGTSVEAMPARVGGFGLLFAALWRRLRRVFGAG